MTTFDFSTALTVIRGGGVVTRAAWVGSGLTLGLMAPPAESGMMPFVAVRSQTGQIMPWTPSHQEMFAEDWYRVEMEGVGHG